MHLRVLHVVLGQALGHVGRHQVGDHDLLVALRRLQLAGDAAVGDHHLVDLVLGEQLLELAVGHDLDGLRLLPPLLQDEDAEQGEHQVADVEPGASFHVPIWGQ